MEGKPRLIESPCGTSILMDNSGNRFQLEFYVRQSVNLPPLPGLGRDSRGLLEIHANANAVRQQQIQCLFLCIHFQIVEPSPLVNHDRNYPTRREESHDKISQRPEVIVEFCHPIPESSLEMEIAGHQAKSFNPSHH